MFRALGLVADHVPQQFGRVALLGDIPALGAQLVGQVVKPLPALVKQRRPDALQVGANAPRAEYLEKLLLRDAALFLDGIKQAWGLELGMVFRLFTSPVFAPAR